MLVFTFTQTQLMRRSGPTEKERIRPKHYGA